MIYTALVIFFFFITICVLIDRRKTILTPKPERPLTSEELREIGIIAPERYDCETFVR